MSFHASYFAHVNFGSGSVTRWWDKMVDTSPQSAWLSRARICKPFMEPRNRFPALAGRYDNPIWRTDPPGYIGRRNRLNVNKFGLSFLLVDVQRRQLKAYVSRVIFSMELLLQHMCDCTVHHFCQIWEKALFSLPPFLLYTPHPLACYHDGIHALCMPHITCQAPLDVIFLLRFLRPNS